MPVANRLTKLLDLKRWTPVPTPAPVATLAGACVISSRLANQRQLYLTSASVAHLYYPFEDGWIQIPSPALAGTFGVGVCGTASAVGPSGTATGGSPTTIVTNLTLARNLRGYDIEITGGPNAGSRRKIKFNTVGANAVITVDAAFAEAITSASSYRLLTPRWYVISGGVTAAGLFKSYDFALNQWTTLQHVGLPANWGTDGRMVATPSLSDGATDVSFASGVVTAGQASTLTSNLKTWAVNQWTNFQIRITGGTGAGQIRTVASNTANIITVSAAWTTVPDTTSTFVIEGNDNFLYLMGNNAIAMYRYDIAANTWTTLAPTAARAAAPGAGMSAHWVWQVPATEDPRWSDENAIINGRRIYSFRAGGAAGSPLDYYDIAANTWVSGVPYAPATETFTTGTKYVYSGDYLYIQKEATGRWFRYSFSQQAMVGLGTNTYPQGAAVVGDTAFDTVDPVSGVRFLNMLLNSSQMHMRCLLI
jgi:hypothetical protein